MGGSKRRRRPLLFGLTFRLVLIIAAACLFLSYLASYIDPSKFSVPLFFGLFFIPILFLNILLLLIALLGRSKSAWIPLIAVLPTLLFAERFYKLGGGREAAQAQNTVKIETYNVGKFRLSKDNLSPAATLDGIAEQIKKDDPDIVCLQEVYLDSAGAAKRIFPGYPHRTYHFFNHSGGQKSGNLILSKFEIVRGGVLTFRLSTNLALYADIVLGTDTVRVYNNHLESYAISPTALVKRIREKRKNTEDLTEEIMSVHAKVKNTVIRRTGQVESIMSNMRKSPYDAIICGDFNDTPMSYTYFKLSSHSKDTFKESGKGHSATYSMLWPLLRIDYIFIPESFTSIGHKVIRNNLSDHYPVISEFSNSLAQSRPYIIPETVRDSLANSN